MSWQISTALADKLDRDVAGKRCSTFRVRVHGLLKEQFSVSLVVHGRIAKVFFLTAPGRTSRKFQGKCAERYWKGLGRSPMQEIRSRRSPVAIEGRLARSLDGLKSPSGLVSHLTEQRGTALRCSTTFRPKSDAVTAPVTVQRLRRNAGVTAQPSAATPFQPARSRQAIVSLMNGPTASAARRGSSSAVSG